MDKKTKYYLQVALWCMLALVALSGNWHVVLGVLLVSALLRGLFGAVANGRRGFKRAKSDASAEEYLLREHREMRHSQPLKSK